MDIDQKLRSKIWGGWQSLKGDTCQKADDLANWQYLDGQAVSRIQEEHLRRLLRHVHDKVPFYRKRLQRCGVVNGRTVNLNRFNALPLLDKKELRTELSDLRSDDLYQREWEYNTSGGSTGEPVRFIQDEEYQEWVSAIKIHFNEWTGYKTGQPRVKLWGSERDLLVGEETLKTKLGRWVRNEHCLNAFRMGEYQMRRYVEQINKVKPVQILAYAQSIYELAKFIKEEGIDVNSPQAIMTSAGTLDEHMRETIRRVFNAPVFDRYGSREVGDIACECEAHKGLHVCAPTHYVEILHPDGTPADPGEVGEIVVTLLTNYAMPLIRYRIGDMGVWSNEECSCGRKWPLLKSVRGRKGSMLRTEKGVYDSTAVTTLFYYKDKGKKELFDSFSKYQLIQKEVDHFRLKIKIEDEVKWEKEKRVLKDKLKRAFGDGIKVDIVYVDEINPTESGKYLYVRSEV